MKAATASKNWRLIIDPPLEGPANMAIDESLLHFCSSSGMEGRFPVLRLYRWKIPTVSLGYNQNVDHAVDRALCRQEGVDIVRRQTGGKAVLHDRELTYSLIASFSSLPFTSSVFENYRIISAALQAGLHILGIRASVAGGDHPAFDASSLGHCFSTLSRYELSFRGKKIVGSAQRRRKNSFLQHGSIMFDCRRELYERITRSESLSDRHPGFVTVSEAAKRDIGFEELSAAVIEGFQSTLGIRLERGILTGEEHALSEELTSGKYRTDRWNLHY